MNKTPFFSVIIPTYNPRKFIPKLLESITHNNCLDMIEVIISDDCSTEQFDDILEQFKNIHFRKISNKKHTGFPRKGRQHGADVARGEWFCFSDQDDYFLKNAFDTMLDFIQKSNATNYIITDFIEEAVATGRKVLRNRKSGWTHGKFYQKSFWNSNGIKYDDVEYCEDINLSNKIDCIIVATKAKIYEYPNPLYVWSRRKDSLSDVEYFKKSMPDYIRATTGVTIQFVEKYLRDAQLIAIFNAKFIVTLYHIYFYYQSDVLNKDIKGLIQSINTLQPLFTKFKELTGFNKETIINLTNTDLIGLYQQTRNSDFSQIPFIEQIPFKDWMNLYLE